MKQRDSGQAKSSSDGGVTSKVDVSGKSLLEGSKNRNLHIEGSCDENKVRKVKVLPIGQNVGIFTLPDCSGYWMGQRRGVLQNLKVEDFLYPLFFCLN